MQATSPTLFSSSDEREFYQINSSKMDIDSSNDVASLFSDGESDIFFDCEEYIQSGVSSEMFFDCEEDIESDMCSIITIDTTEEYCVCSTAEANEMISKLVIDCDSKLVTVAGCGPLEPPIDQQKIAFPSCSSADYEPLSSSNYHSLSGVDDHILYEDVEEDYDSQSSCYSVSPAVPLYPDSYTSSDMFTPVFSSPLPTGISASVMPCCFESTPAPAPAIVQQCDYDDHDSDIVSITSTDTSDEFSACSTAETGIFFSKLVKECDSTLISVSGSDLVEPSVSGSGTVEPSVSGSNACDEFDNASTNIINTNIVEPHV
ncbi:unnamed protein product [Ambrosiozyma monospora]|uniref:Unnamed protein product n=1 Tax=Ambrosiozyma monospora TaxID=43982 RepID=A0A9W7DJD0_AMBMO|nr:unnamed protein product [Ambrosiozyma monospora]